MNAQISRIFPSLPPHLVTSGPELARVGLSSIKSGPDKIDVLIPLATHPSTMRCRWNAVVEIGVPRVPFRNELYGSKASRKFPFTLNVLTE